MVFCYYTWLHLFTQHLLKEDKTKLIGTKFSQNRRKILALVNAGIQDGHITFKQATSKSEGL